MVSITALEEWRPECEGAAYPLQLITNHKHDEYFITEEFLNQRLIRLLKILT